MDLPASAENTRGDMSSYSCAAEVIPLGLFNDAINGSVNTGACWDISQRLGACPDATRTYSQGAHACRPNKH